LANPGSLCQVGSGRNKSDYAILVKRDRFSRLLERYLMDIRPAILSQFETVAKEQDKKLAPLTDDLVLLDSGLDSLCFAIIVARLEDELGFDPFSELDEITFPVTVGDFIRCYENVRS
jgi:acyl carrier protein